MVLNIKKAFPMKIHAVLVKGFLWGFFKIGGIYVLADEYTGINNRSGRKW